jgi:hypothetical protein
MPKIGAVNNPNGRPKGVPNKVTKEVREVLRLACSGTIEDLPALLAQIENPKDKIDALTKLLPYFAGKLQNITIEDNREDENEEREMVWQKKPM